MLKRIGIIGDVHAEDELLETSLEFLATQNLDAILCVGDVVDGIGDANRYCELLRDFKVETVRGNHDRWILENTMRDLPNATARETLTSENLAWLQSLSSTRLFPTVAGDLMLCHGVAENDMENVRPNDDMKKLISARALQTLLRDDRFRFLVGGHTHQRMIRTFPNAFGGIVFINAGTLFRHQNPAVATVDFNARQMQFHDFEDDVLVPNCRKFAF